MRVKPRFSEKNQWILTLQINETAESIKSHLSICQVHKYKYTMHKYIKLGCDGNLMCIIWG